MYKPYRVILKVVRWTICFMCKKGAKNANRSKPKPVNPSNN